MVLGKGSRRDNSQGRGNLVLLAFGCCQHDTVLHSHLDSLIGD